MSFDQALALVQHHNWGRETVEDPHTNTPMYWESGHAIH
jgi:hypothetical protein